MKINFILSILILSIFTSCTKKTQVKGVVYSKHDIPVSNAAIYLETYKTSSYPTYTQPDIAKTDNNGYYEFSFKGSTQNYYHVKCISDSGDKGEYVKLGAVNTIDIHL